LFSKIVSEKKFSSTNNIVWYQEGLLAVNAHFSPNICCLQEWLQIWQKIFRANQFCIHICNICESRNFNAQFLAIEPWNSVRANSYWILKEPIVKHANLRYVKCKIYVIVKLLKDKQHILTVDWNNLSKNK
jgi:hypothetical protein